MASEKLYGNTLRKYPYFTFVITRLIHVDCHFKVECEAGRVLTEKKPDVKNGNGWHIQKEQDEKVLLPKISLVVQIGREI